MIWFSLIFNYLGLATIAAAMESHRRAFPRVANRVRPAGLFIIGGVGQAIALAAALSSSEIAAGIVVWTVGWAACGLTLSLLLAVRPATWWLPVCGLLLLAAADRFV